MPAPLKTTYGTAPSSFVVAPGPPRRGFFARTYSILALLALLNMSGLVALGVYLCASGRLDRGRVQRLLTALRDSRTGALRAESPSGETADSPAGISSQAAIQTVLQDREVERLRTDRLLVDLQHERALLDRRMLQLQEDTAEFERRSASHESRLAAERAQELSESFQQVVQTIAGLKPRSAVQALMARPQAEAVQILADMPARKRAQIADACRSAEQVRWRDAMFEAMVQTSAQPGPETGDQR